MVSFDFDRMLIIFITFTSGRHAVKMNGFLTNI